LSDRLLTGIGIRTKEAISSLRANALFSLDDSKADLARCRLGACMFPAMVTAEPSAGPVLVVVTTSGISTSGPRGGPFNTTGSAKFSVTAPAWLRADPKVGATDPSGVLVNIEINAHAKDLPPGRYGPSVAFTNLTNGRGTTIRPAVLTVHVTAAPKGSGSEKNYLLDHKGDWLRTEQGERLLAE